MAHPDAWILAGGTDVGLWINKALQSTRTILYTGSVAGLGDIEEKSGGVEIGAAVPLEAAFHALNRHYPEFAHVWLRFASLPIRSSGTLGGNIANGSPIGDAMPLLIALGSEVALRLGDVARTVPLESLYLDYRKQARAPGEWVERVRIPQRAAGLELAAYKNAKRNEQDISAVCFAIALRREADQVRSVRIALGGMAGIPKRALKVEAALTGTPWSEGSVRAAMVAMAQDFSPMSDMRASAGYRLRVAQNLLLRFFHESTASTQLETRVI
jgi:xanthine dehydrogenase small subunit